MVGGLDESLLQGLFANAGRAGHAAGHAWEYSAPQLSAEQRARVPEWTRPIRFTPGAIASLAYLAVLATVLIFLRWFWLVQRHGASRVSPFIFLMPVSGVVLGALILRESLPVLVFPSLTLVALGLVLVHLPDGALRRSGTTRLMD